MKTWSYAPLMVTLAMFAGQTGLSLTKVSASFHEASSGDPASYWEIAVRFNKPIQESDLPARKAGFKIFDSGTGTDVALVYVGPGDGPAPSLPNAVHEPVATQTFTVFLAAAALTPARSYMLFIVGFLEGGQAQDGLSARLSFVAIKEPTRKGLPAGSGIGTGAELSKAASDMFLSGEVDFASGSALGGRTMNGAADLKVSYPYIRRFRFLSKAAHNQVFSPLFALNASSIKNHDPNAMSLGLSWISVLDDWKAGRYTSFLQFQKDVIIESTKNFSVADVVASAYLRIGLSDAVTHLPKVSLTPFAGGEFGENLRSPLAALKGTPIARGVLGTDATIFFNLSGRGMVKGIGFDGQWERRYLAGKEMTANSSDPGNLELMTFGRSPRDHAAANLKLAVADSLSLTMGYEWGELPPAYQKVHNLVKIGLLYQAKLKQAP